ncbi:MAG: ABC transporter ATP-binding protein, partial [Verrucomicrobiales bacterium]|nr:ABC transporter ATP-binding protein [Verrucomicrobiales bacterium]
MSTGEPSTRDAAAPNALAKSFRHFAPEIRRQRGWILVATAALFAEVGLRLLEPWPLKYVFDRLLIPRAATLARDGIAAGNAALPVETPPLLVGAVLAVLAIAGLRALAAYGSTVGFAIVGNRVLSNVRARLFRQLQFLPLGFHDRARTGDLVVRVTGDIGVLQDTAVTAFLPLIARVFVLAGMVATMFWMNWRLATLAVALLPFFLVRTRRLAGEMRGVARKQRKREGAMAATAAESFAAAHAVRSLSLESRFAESFASANERSQKADVRGKRLAAALERSVDVFIAAAGAVVLGFGARFVLAGTLTPGDLLV